MEDDTIRLWARITRNLRKQKNYNVAIYFVALEIFVFIRIALSGYLALYNIR